MDHEGKYVQVADSREALDKMLEELKAREKAAIERIRKSAGR
jgi:hypothetical protein